MRRKQGLGIEAELKASRPTPSSHFVQSIAARINPRPSSSGPGRASRSSARSQPPTVVALGASGGFSYAASSIVSAAKVTAQAVHLTAASPSPGHPSAAAQYLGAPTITKLTATSGKAGTAVNVMGTNLGGITAVSVAGLSVDTFTNASTGSVGFKVPATANSAVGPVVVTNPGGTASFGTFTVMVQPNITSLSVTSGTLTTLEPGQILRINGSGFRGTDIKPGSVTIDGAPVKTFTLVSGHEDTEIDATVPSNLSTTKTGPVVVKNAAGASNAFGVTEGAAGPTIAVAPANGKLGDTIKIMGKNFVEGVDVVKINGVTAPHVNSGASTWSSTAAFVTVPSPALNSSGVAVGPITISDGNGTGTSPKTFMTIVTPTISSVAPASGEGVGGFITITGHHFTGTSSVKFTGGTTGKVATFSVTNDGSITAKVPVGAVTGAITVTDAAGSASSGSFTVLPPPTITGVAQGVTPAIPGTTVTITGTGFDTVGTVTVTFFGNVSGTATVSSSTSMTVSVPAGAKTGTVKISEAAGTATSKGTQKVTVASAPTIASILPTTQVANDNPAHAVTIKGKGFKGTNNTNPTVTFAGGAAGTHPDEPLIRSSSSPFRPAPTRAGSPWPRTPAR